MSVTDNFNRADGDPGASWTGQANTPQILSNQLTDGGGGNYGSMYRSGESYNDAHSSQITNVNGALYQGPAVRMSGVGGSSSWYTYFSHGVIQKLVNGAGPTTIGTPDTFTTGDTAKLDVNGTTITPYKNGVAGTPITDSELTGGAPGVTFYDAGNPIVDDWIGTGEVVASNNLAVNIVEPVIGSSLF